MEPIDYKRAITRRWPLILVCAIITTVVAVLIPVHESATASQTTYQAQALTGIPPSRTSNANALSAEVSQIEFYAEQQPVYVATAKAAKIKGGIVKLRNEITLKSIKSKKKKIPPGSFYVQVTQLTKAGAADLANTFVKQLTIYADQQLAAQHAAAIKLTEAQISSLSSQLSSLDARIASSDEGLQQAEDAYSSYDDDHETEDIPHLHDYILHDYLHDGGKHLPRTQRGGGPDISRMLGYCSTRPCLFSFSPVQSGVPRLFLRTTSSRQTLVPARTLRIRIPCEARHI